MINRWIRFVDELTRRPGTDRQQYIDRRFPGLQERLGFPVLGEDIFAEFEKKKQQILNFDIGEQPESERRSKFAGLKFGNDFNLMDDEDDDF